MKTLPIITALLITACNPVQQATTAPPSSEAPLVEPVDPETVLTLRQRFIDAYKTVYSENTPPDSVYTTSPRSFSFGSSLTVYSAVLSHESFNQYRLTVEDEQGVAAYWIKTTGDTVLDGQPYQLFRNASFANGSGVKVIFDWLDDDTAQLTFTLTFNNQHMATLLVR